MVLARTSFKNAADWKTAYRPTLHAGHNATRCGATLFGLSSADRSYLLTVDQEFVWTVISVRSFEYIVPGKKQGSRVIGYLITDNPVLLRDLESRWAIGYTLIDWDKWEQEQEARKQSKPPSSAPIAAEAPAPKPATPKRPVAAPLGQALKKAVSAVMEKLEPPSMPASPKDGVKETQAATAPAFSAESVSDKTAPKATPTKAASAETAPVETASLSVAAAERPQAVVAEASSAVVRATPASPRIAPPEAPPAPEPALFPDLPAPLAPTKLRTTKKHTPKTSFPKPPRPKPRPKPQLPLPPELPPPTPAAPDPLPTPPVTPEMLAARSEAIVRPRTMAPPFTPPSETPGPDPLPAPPPPRPKRRSRLRILPVGTDAAQLDFSVFGSWPGAQPCDHCAASGFVGSARQGLTACEACDGRGWNPPLDSPLELEIVID